MKFDTEKKYYVYVWYIKETQEIFYVGKGNGNRCKTRKRKDNPKFNEITQKYNCDYKIIKENLTEKEAFDLEISTIAFYREKGNPLINILDGGANPPLLKGIPKSKEWKEKISISNKKFYEEHPERKKQLSENLKSFLKTEKGKEFLKKSLQVRNTQEYREQQSIRSRIANNTPEYKAKQSEIIKKLWLNEDYKKKHSGANNNRAQAVRQYDLSGNLIKEYDTITQAAIETGVQISKISSVAKGKRKTTGGYIWKYANDKHLTNNVKRKAIKDSSCSIPILQFDKSGNLLKEYKSIAEAAKQNNYPNRTNIISNLKGKTKTAYGYVWRYKQGDTVSSQNENFGRCNDYPERE